MTNHKCYFDKEGKLNPCNGMIKTLKLLDLPVGGVFVFQIIRDNGSIYDLGVSVRKRKDETGILFNNCPFCNEELLNKDNQLGTDKIPYYSGVLS